jgi:hypothetical protein
LPSQQMHYQMLLGLIIPSGTLLAKFQPWEQHRLMWESADSMLRWVWEHSWSSIVDRVMAHHPIVRWPKVVGLRMFRHSSPCMCKPKATFHKQGGTQVANNFCVIPGRCWVCKIRCWWFLVDHVHVKIDIAWCNVVKSEELYWMCYSGFMTTVSELLLFWAKRTFTEGARYCRFWSQAMGLTATCCANLQIAMHNAELSKPEGVYWMHWCIMYSVYLIYAMDQAGGRAILALWVVVILQVCCNCWMPAMGFVT